MNDCQVPTLCPQGSITKVTDGSDLAKLKLDSMLIWFPKSPIRFENTNLRICVH